MYEKLNKKARSLMLVNEILLGGILTLVFIGGWFFLKNVVEVSLSSLWLVLILIFCWGLSLLAPFVRYERYRYRFTDEEIDIREGFLSIERNIVPIERLHKVAMVSGPLDRIFGLTKVIVTTAGGDVTIRFLEMERAEAIVENLKKRINSYAIKSRNTVDVNPFSAE